VCFGDRVVVDVQCYGCFYDGLGLGDVVEFFVVGILVGVFGYVYLYE